MRQPGRSTQRRPRGNNGTGGIDQRSTGGNSTLERHPRQHAPLPVPLPVPRMSPPHQTFLAPTTSFAAPLCRPPSLELPYHHSPRIAIRVSPLHLEPPLTKHRAIVKAIYTAIVAYSSSAYRRRYGTNTFLSSMTNNNMTRAEDDTREQRPIRRWQPRIMPRKLPSMPM